MAVVGGAAQAVGIWFQSIGALASVLPWDFRGVPGDVTGMALFAATDEELQFALEYFDMDLARRTPNRFDLVQFKVGTQEALQPFTPEEVRAIFRGAARAALKHQRQSGRPLSGFVLASNRPPGPALAALQRAPTTALQAPTDHLTMAELAQLPAPDGLFRKRPRKPGATSSPTSVRTLDALAVEIISEETNDDDTSIEDRHQACLKALGTFQFARANPGQLTDVVEKWFCAWGLLPDEHDRVLHSVIAMLCNPANAGSFNNPTSIMRRVLVEPSATQLEPLAVWPAVISDLSTRTWPDEPTRRLFEPQGFAPWLADRRSLLRGLPYVDLDPTQAIPGSAVQPKAARIIALVGPGGVGKTALLASLLGDVAEGLWDWQTGTARKPGTFLGYPLILDAAPTALEEVGPIVAGWAGRLTLREPVARCQVASDCANEQPVMWIGLDGLDEVPEQQLPLLAKAVAAFANKHPTVRIALTCRPDDLDLIRASLEVNALLHVLAIDEFTPEEAERAILAATNQQLVLGEPSGRRKFRPTVSASDELTAPFRQSSRQPLFVGIVHTLYSTGGAEAIHAAHAGDLDGWLCLADAYVRVTCRRIARRLHARGVNAQRVFRAIRHLVSTVPNPSGATHADWERVCKEALDDPTKWHDLYQQCATSGVIRDLTGGAFEWRHPIIATCVPRLTEDPRWP